MPAHFPTDAHGLARFDGTALYEHADPRQGFHPDWNTAIFNFGRQEVFAFLLNNALYWLEKFHVDGLRVDAVASMLYLDYSRKAGEWIPNQYGGRENLEAVAFLQAMNRAVYGKHPGRVTFAEESTSWPKVSAPVYDGGLGFGFKWNMGWMHDTLQYMALRARPPAVPPERPDLRPALRLLRELRPAAVSHDEVVHGKGSLIGKMPGDAWQKFANLRAYYAFMWGYPGKKLLFMGQEFAQGAEWSEARGLDWWQLDIPAHKGVQSLVRDLNRLYRVHPRAARARLRGRGLRVAGRRRRGIFRLRLAAQIPRPAPGGGGLQLHPRPARRLRPAACRTPAAGARSSTPTPPPTAARASETWAASTRTTASMASARW